MKNFNSIEEYNAAFRKQFKDNWECEIRHCKNWLQRYGKKRNDSFFILVLYDFSWFYVVFLTMTADYDHDRFYE
jgi:hypothetical protein